MGISFNINVRYKGCLASNPNYLFLVGGQNPVNFISLNTLQILNLSSYQWLVSPPSMIGFRESLACIVSPINNRLWAIGGEYLGTDLNGIEFLSVDTDIAQQNWTLTPASLINRAAYPRAIIVQDNIWIIGGYNNQYGHLDEIQIINPITGSVSVGPYLNYSISNTAPIYVPNYGIFVFGGFTLPNGTTNRWQYLLSICCTFLMFFCAFFSN